MVHQYEYYYNGRLMINLKMNVLSWKIGCGIDTNRQKWSDVMDLVMALTTNRQKWSDVMDLVMSY